jgi:peroxiredoxin Q/BCP
VILGISFDDVAANRAFAEKHSFPFKLLCDTDKKIGETYGAKVPDRDNPRRISYLIGPDRKIVKAYDPVKPAEHPAQVLADLAA